MAAILSYAIPTITLATSCIVSCGTGFRTLPNKNFREHVFTKFSTNPFKSFTDKERYFYAFSLWYTYAIRFTSVILYREVFLTVLWKNRKELMYQILNVYDTLKSDNTFSFKFIFQVFSCQYSLVMSILYRFISEDLLWGYSLM